MMLETNNTKVVKKSNYDKEKYKAYYEQKKQDKDWVKHRNAVAKANYYKRKAKKAKLEKENEEAKKYIIDTTEPILASEWSNIAENITKVQPKYNYPIINKDYRIIKNINGFGGLCFNVQTRKSFLGIKYWSYLRNSCGSKIQYADKDEAKRTIEAFLYNTILTEKNF